MSARFIETPHLPQGKVGLCALGEKYRENLEKPLRNLGITPFWLPENRAVDPRLSGHADLVLLHLGGNRVLTYLDRLPDIGLDAVKVTGQGREYPADARLCACVVGRFCIHNFRISEAVLHLRSGCAQRYHLRRRYSEGRSPARPGRAQDTARIC